MLKPFQRKTMHLKNGGQIMLNVSALETALQAELNRQITLHVERMSGEVIEKILQEKMARVKFGQAIEKEIFDELEKQLNRLESKIDNIEDRFKAFEKSVNDHEEKINSLRTNYNALSQHYNDATGDYDTLTDRLDEMEAIDSVEVKENFDAIKRAIKDAGSCLQDLGV